MTSRPRTRIRVATVEDDRVRLDAAAAHRLGRVLRLEPGDELWAFDGRGRERRMRLAALGERDGALEAVGPAVVVHAGGLEIVVLQALAKGDKLPRIVRAVTELGAHRIDLVVTRRTVARPPADRAAAIAERLGRVASEAARQCGRADVPAVLPPAPLEERLGEPLPALRLVAWEEASRALADVLPEAAPPGVAVLVGPEGGLEPAEIDRLASGGFQPVSLGPRILRTETAAPALCAVLQYRWGDLGGARN